MRLSYVLATFTATAVLAHLPNAAAQYRCDCTSVVDTCGAEVVARGTFLEIKTNAPQCARVDYFVDGQPFVSVVADGEHRENWLARTTAPRILVQSCQVCATATASAPRATTPSPAAPTEGESGLQPLIAGVPEYPQAAGGVRGYAEVEFTVTAAGTVENPRVVAAEPRNVFNQAALAAVARRRYPEDAAREPLVQKERIEFQPPTAMTARGAASGGPRNQCLREGVVYNYGEMVDVGLINACTDPLVVFGCAQGTGRELGRWVCSTSEQRGDVLVQAGDQRLGRRYSAGSANDLRTYTYTDSFSVTRAPNSQYWWIACAEGDAQCRSDASLWTRAVSGQAATVNPEARSPIAVASSD